VYEGIHQDLENQVVEDIVVIDEIAEIGAKRVWKRSALT